MCSLRQFQNEKCDVILKYLPDEVRQLKAQGEVPQDLDINENQDAPASGIEFVENNEEEESDSDDSDSESEEEEEGTINFNFSQKKKVEEIDIDNI